MIGKVELYCLNLLKTTFCKKLAFHNEYHTKEVVSNVEFLGEQLSLSQVELEPILIAAWFHDIGLMEVYNGHEEVSKRLAREFLTRERYHTDKVTIVLDCIEATKLPHNPKNNYQEIICDADIMHISNPNFFYRIILLRIEWEMKLKKIFSDHEWLLMNLDFLNKTNFCTPYGIKELERGKIENLLKVVELLKFCNKDDDVRLNT